MNNSSKDFMPILCVCGSRVWWPAAIEEGIGGRQIWHAPSMDCDAFACVKCGVIVSQCFISAEEDGIHVIGQNGMPVDKPSRETDL